MINGDGKQTRDYVHVSDVVEANLLSLKSSATGFFNIGTGVETDVNEIFRLVSKYSRSDFKEIHGSARAGEQKTSGLSYQKAQKVLGWSPRVELKDGIKETVAWFMNHPGRV